MITKIREDIVFMSLPTDVRTIGSASEGKLKREMKKAPCKSRMPHMPANGAAYADVPLVLKKKKAPEGKALGAFKYAMTLGYKTRGSNRSLHALPMHEGNMMFHLFKNFSKFFLEKKKAPLPRQGRFPSETNPKNVSMHYQCKTHQNCSKRDMKKENARIRQGRGVFNCKNMILTA
jgi:hypothetical protein